MVLYPQPQSKLQQHATEIEARNEQWALNFAKRRQEMATMKAAALANLAAAIAEDERLEAQIQARRLKRLNRK